MHPIEVAYMVHLYCEMHHGSISHVRVLIRQLDLQILTAILDRGTIATFVL